jgi:hypothetical protein
LDGEGKTEAEAEAEGVVRAMAATNAAPDESSSLWVASGLLGAGTVEEPGE